MLDCNFDWTYVNSFERWQIFYWSKRWFDSFVNRRQKPLTSVDNGRGNNATITCFQRIHPALFLFLVHAVTVLINRKLWQIDATTDRQTDGRTDGWKHGRMDVWTHGDKAASTLFIIPLTLFEIHLPLI